MVPRVLLHSTSRDWVPTEPHVFAEHPPLSDVYQAYVSHAGTEHVVDEVGFLLAWHLLASAVLLLELLHATSRVCTPAEPHVAPAGVLHVDHAPSCQL